LLALLDAWGCLSTGLSTLLRSLRAALGPEQNAIVLELGLHHAAATAVDCEGAQARRRRTVLTERGGLIELYQVWLDLVSTTMVKRTRFRSLADAVTEQQVFEAISSPCAASNAHRSCQRQVSRRERSASKRL